MVNLSNDYMMGQNNWSTTLTAAYHMIVNFRGQPGTISQGGQDREKMAFVGKNDDYDEDDTDAALVTTGNSRGEGGKRGGGVERNVEGATIAE